mmetsp:Transcript_10818/g.16103  ORF Transcript_10818/g.16103 Transcript_10818/m.16103 type:complete len:216 (+) Transcript_10818:987-1634(+)
MCDDFNDLTNLETRRPILLSCIRFTDIGVSPKTCSVFFIILITEAVRFAFAASSSSCVKSSESCFEISIRFAPIFSSSTTRIGHGKRKAAGRLGPKSLNLSCTQSFQTISSIAGMPLRWLFAFWISRIVLAETQGDNRPLTSFNTANRVGFELKLLLFLLKRALADFLGSVLSWRTCIILVNSSGASNANASAGYRSRQYAIVLRQRSVREYMIQ